MTSNGKNLIEKDTVSIVAINYYLDHETTLMKLILFKL